MENGMMEERKKKMYTFLLQVEKNGHYSEDTATIARLIDERNWLNFNDEPMRIKECRFKGLTEKMAKDTIPVGSVEFVNKALRLGYGAGPMQPINIPLPLFSEDYLGRKCEIVRDKTEIRKLFLKWNADKLFVKSNSKIKAGYTDFYTPKDNIPDDEEYFVSEVVDIVSEWRCFVYRNALKGVKNYSGDPWVLPSRGFVEDCIKEVGNDIVAYTLDVVVLKSGRSVVLEVHNFVSCGLYGFDDAAIIPMLINGFKREILTKNHKNSSSHTCSECEFFLGGGDWNLCCEKEHKGYPCGFLCYEDTPVCEMFEKKKKKKE